MEYVNGRILLASGGIDGYIGFENGIISEISEGPCPEEPVATGIIVPNPVNAHTHCADGKVKAEKGMSIEDLVAPPNGLKHRYLKDAKDSEITASIWQFQKESRRSGTIRFIDFREGGVKGCKLLRNAVPDAVILGRPVSPEFDPDEMHSLCEVSDGFGLSSISDIPSKYLEQIADFARDNNKILALHVSERVREDIDLALSLDPRFVVHMTKATKSDMTACAESEVTIVSCPGSNLFFDNIPPVDDMTDSGADICIGTDNAMLRKPSMKEEIALYLDLLGKKGYDTSDVPGKLIRNGRKLIMDDRSVDLSIGGEASFVVLPGDDVGKAFSSSYRPIAFFGGDRVGSFAPDIEPTQEEVDRLSEQKHCCCTRDCSDRS